MKPEVDIRVCTLEDIPVLQVFQEELMAGGPLDEGDRDMARRLSPYVLMAEVNSEPAGYILAAVETIEFMKSEIGRAAFPNEKVYLEVQELYVRPAFRNRGIGSQLARTAVQKAKEGGIEHSMVYSSNADYTRTARFYEKCGFRMWHIFMTQ